MSSGEDTIFGEIAVEKGLLTSEQVEECVQAQKVMADVGIEQPLGQVAAAKKYLDRIQVREITREVMKRSGRRIKIGSYEVVAKLGQGGMGAVYKAELPATGKAVAIKVLPPDLAKNSTFVERFRREADVAARLDHPNIVRAIEAGESGGFHYFAMEFVEGESVYRRLKREGVIPEGEGLQIARHVALALQHAHDAGLVHRDIKPDNIFLAADGQAKLGDLGLARSAGAEESRLTQTGVMVGTPHYVSPEQAKGSADVDTRSDIYSLGATLYHMVTGQVPFEGDTAMAVLNKHLNEELPWPADLNDELTDGICLLIAKMMAKDPADRYQEPLELTAEIDRVLRGEAPVSRILDVGRSSVKKAARARRAGAAAERRLRQEATPRPSARRAGGIAAGGPTSARMMPVKKSSPALIAGVLAGVAMLAVAAVIVMSGPGDPETPLPVSARPKPPAREPDPKTSPEPGPTEPEGVGPVEPVTPGRHVKPGKPDFGNATVRETGGGRFEVVWQFDRPLDRSAWYLQDVLPCDAGGGAVKMLYPGGCYYRRAMTPRAVFDGDFSIEVEFSDVKGLSQTGVRPPVPGVAVIATDTRADGARQACTVPGWFCPNREWGAVGKSDGPNEWLADMARERERGVRIIRKGSTISRHWRAGRGGQWHTAAAECRLRGPVGVCVGLSHSYLASYTATLKSVRIIGTPAGTLELPDPALSVPRKATAADQWAYAQAVKGDYDKRVLAWRAQGLYWPRETAYLGREGALFKQTVLGSPGEAIEFWDRAERQIPRREAVATRCVHNVGRAYMVLGHPEKALECFAAGRREHEHYCCGYGDALNAMGRFDEAVGEWRRCAEKWPRSEQSQFAYLHMATACRERGELRKCLDTIQEMIKRWPTSHLTEKARKLIPEVESQLASGEPATGPVAEVPKPADRSRVDKALDDAESLALAGKFDEAGRKLAAARAEKVLAEFAGELAAAAKVVDEIEVAAKAAKSGFAKAVGREIEVTVGGKPKLCKITRVHYDAFDVEREVRVGGRKTMMTTRVRFADLDPKALDALKGKYEPKTPDGHVAAAILALAKRDLAAAGASLGQAGEHTLVPRYQAKLAALRAPATPATVAEPVPPATPKVEILYREGWEKGGKHGWAFGDVIAVPGRGKVLSAAKRDVEYASFSIQSDWRPHIPVAHGAYLSFWYYLEKPSASMTMHMANTVEGHKSFSFKLGRDRPLVAGEWSFFSIKLEDFVTPAGGNFEDGDLCKQLVISGKERPAPKFMIDNVTISKGGLPPDAPGARESTPAAESTRIGGVNFGRAKVRPVGGGRVEAIWEFDAPLDPEAWYLWNVLPRDAGSGAVRMILRKPAGSPCHPSRAMAPRVVFDGDLEVEAVFTGVSGRSTKGKAWPLPTVSICSAAPARGARPCVRFPHGGASSGATGEYWGKIAPSGRPLPGNVKDFSEAVIKLVRRGTTVECSWSASRTKPGRLIGKVSLPAGPVGVDVGLYHVYALRYTARLERLRIVGRPVSVLGLPDPADAVPRKGSAAALIEHGNAIKSRTAAEAHAVWRALVLRYPSSAREVHKALHSLNIYGAPGEAVKLWEAKRGELDMAQAVRLGTHRYMATAYAMIGMKDEAVACYKLGGLKSGFDLHGLAGVHFLYGEHDDAIKYHEMDVARSPTDWRISTAWLRLGECYRAKGDPTKALECFRNVLAKFPGRNECAPARKAIAEIEATGR